MNLGLTLEDITKNGEVLGVIWTDPFNNWGIESSSHGNVFRDQYRYRSREEAVQGLEDLNSPLAV